MQMATYNWNQFNPNIVYGKTRKQFYNKYLYKLTLFVPGSRYITADAKYPTVQSYLDYLTARNMYGTWRNIVLDAFDLDCVEHLRVLRKSFPNLSFRCESNTFTVYALTEAELEAFHAAIYGQYQDRVRELWAPEDAAAAALLIDGKLVGSKLEFKFKIIFKEAGFRSETTNQIYEYLVSVNDRIRISKASLKQFEPNRFKGHLVRPTRYIWGAYFYTNDDVDITYINLLCPGVIHRVYEMA